MPAERVNMRRVREMLKYRFEQELGYKAISLRVGAVPSTVHRLIDGAADVLSDDPLMLARHANQLQSMQAALEVLEHLARVLQAADHMGAVDIIALQALRARLLKRPIF